MSLTPSPLQFFRIMLPGWVYQQQRDVIEYLQENRLLREQRGPRCLRFIDAQCRQFAAKAKTFYVGRRAGSRFFSSQEAIESDRIVDWVLDSCRSSSPRSDIVLPC